MSFHPLAIAERFRKYLPVVVDIETGGFNAGTDAILEFAAITIAMQDDGQLTPDERFTYSVEPFPGANIESASLAFTGIDLTDPNRNAVSEKEALQAAFKGIRKAMKRAGCVRSIMVAHNSAFDMGFLTSAAARNGLKRSPFHPFSTFDTVTLCGLAFGQTVLSRACECAHIPYDEEQAHSAGYDCLKCAEVFCFVVNRWQRLGGYMHDHG